MTRRMPFSALVKSENLGNAVLANATPRTETEKNHRLKGDLNIMREIGTRNPRKKVGKKSDIVILGKLLHERGYKRKFKKDKPRSHQDRLS